MATDISLPPIQKLIAAYAKGAHRRGFCVIFAMDNRFGDIVRSTTEPLIGQMKLTWWSDAIEKPTEKRPTGEPLIAEMAFHQTLFEDALLWDELIAGWTILLETGDLDQSLLERYARQRGGAVVKLAAKLCGNKVSDNLLDLGASWALWDIARNISDPKTADLAFEMAAGLSHSAGNANLSREMRPISIMRKLISEDIKLNSFEHDLHSPRTAFKIISHGLFGL